MKPCSYIALFNVCNKTKICLKLFCNNNKVALLLISCYFRFTCTYLSILFMQHQCFYIWAYLLVCHLTMVFHLFYLPSFYLFIIMSLTKFSCSDVIIYLMAVYMFQGTWTSSGGKTVFNSHWHVVFRLYNGWAIV